MYSDNRSLMARISGKVKGSGCCVQLTGQFSHRGNDVRNLVVQVYGCWEWHGVPPFIVDLLRTYKSPQAAGIRCTIAGYEGDVREAQTGRQNGFDERLRLRFREWCVDRGVTGPHYEYPCSDCSKKFSMVLTLPEREMPQSAGARKSNSSGLHSTRRPPRRDELHKCRAGGILSRFGNFHVCLGC